MQVWSYGGGIQTIAIDVLIHRGAIARPDLSVIADTTREAPTTWAYLDNVMRPYLREVGVNVEVAPHDLSKADLYRGESLVIPAFHEAGKRLAFCSGEWKRDVIKRWLRLRGVEKCDVWIGYSWDERRRCTQDARDWYNHVHPLLEMVPAPLTRDDCIALIRDEGLPVPSKSRCFMCPHQNDEEWAQVKHEWPELWGKAVDLEAAARELDDLGGVWFHKQRVPLDQVVLKTGNEFEPARGCDGQGCFT